MAAVVSKIINIFAAPTETFEDIKTNPKWMTAFLFVAAVNILYGYFMLPFMHRILEETLQARMDYENVQQTLSAMKVYQIIGLLFALISLLIKWLFISTLLYYGAILFNSQQIDYKAVFSAVVYSEFILLLMGVVNLLILYIRGTESITTATDLNAVIGLDYFMPDKSNNLPLFALLNNFNIFSVWYVGMLAIGVSIIAGISKIKSAILASSVWLILVCIQTAFAMLSESFQGMMGM